MKLFKKIAILIYILFFTYLSFGTEMGPTKEEIFMYNFIENLYTFNNTSLQNLSSYKTLYPQDKYSLELKNLMTEKAFNEFNKTNHYYNFIVDGYSFGYDSTVSHTNIKLMSSTSNNFTFSFRCNIELNYNHKSKKELYRVNGEVTITKFNNGYKISKISKIKFPANEAFPLVYKLI